jgi:hypothetical protein
MNRQKPPYNSGVKGQDLRPDPEWEIEDVRQQQASRGRRNPHANDQKELRDRIIAAARELSEPDFENFLIAVLGLRRGSERFEKPMRRYRADFPKKP